VTTRIAVATAAFVLCAGAGLAVRGANQSPPPAAAPDGGMAPLSDKVKVVVQTVPPEKATVFWGKKSIGLIRGKNKPLIFERPRDSGPMDLVIRAQGFIPVHTRAYTFSDFKLYVKLTPIEEKKSLFGYKEALPDAGAPEAGAAMVAGSPDAGAPPPP
jgi:hypothetical protein